MTTEEKLRVAISGQWEEVKTFAVETMVLATITGDMATGFQKFEGKPILDQFRSAAVQIGGYIDAFREASAEIVPTIHYSYNAGPTVEGMAYQQMKQEIVAALKAAMRFDAVALALHGAAIAEGVDLSVISGMMQEFDGGQLCMVCCDPRDYRIVVVKSASHFRAWYTDVASGANDCDPPGIASNGFTTFTFQRKTQELYPLDADAVYPPPGVK